VSRFDHVLRRAERRLSAREPDRSRILQEMAQDLEDLYGAYRERGLGEAESLRRAEAALGASAEVVDELGGLHAGMYERLFRRFSARRRHRVERVLLTALTLLAVAGGIFALAASPVLTSASPFLWPLLFIAAVSGWTAVARALALFTGPHRPGWSPRSGLGALPALAALSLAVGALGATLELWDSAGAAARAGTWDLLIILPYLGRAAELLTLALSLSLVVLLAWFQLHRRAAVIERARAELRRITAFPTDPGGDA
jgi:hypothetical protein